MTPRLVHIAVRVDERVPDDRVAYVVRRLLLPHIHEAIGADPATVRIRSGTLHEDDDAFFRKHTFAETGVEG